MVIIIGSLGLTRAAVADGSLWIQDWKWTTISPGRVKVQGEIRNTTLCGARITLALHLADDEGKSIKDERFEVLLLSTESTRFEHVVGFDDKKVVKNANLSIDDRRPW